MGITVTVAVSAPLNPEFSSKAIMWATGYDASHMLMIYKGMVYHCDDNGVEWITLEEFQKTRRIVRSIEVPLDCNESEFMGWMKFADDIKYGMRSWPGFSLKLLRPFLGDGKKTMVCSEFVLRALCDMSKKVRSYFGRMDLDFVDQRQGFEHLTKCFSPGQN